VQLAATISPRLLRCVLNTTDMVTLKTAEIAVTSSDAGILTTQTPGLGLSVNEELLGEPVGSWSSILPSTCRSYNFGPRIQICFTVLWNGEATCFWQKKLH